MPHNTYENQLQNIGKDVDEFIKRRDSHLHNYAVQLQEIQRLAEQIARKGSTTSPDELVRKCLNINVFCVHIQKESSE